MIERLIKRKRMDEDVEKIMKSGLNRKVNL
jgi:hypothetical protein